MTKDEQRSYNQAYYARNRTKILAHVRAKKFGVTPEQFEAMLAAQDFKCAVCGTNDPGMNRDWCVDHNHTSGDVRGLLCNGCNKGLGHFKENIEALHGAISYLRKYSVC